MDEGCLAHARRSQDCHTKAGHLLQLLPGLRGGQLRGRQWGERLEDELVLRGIVKGKEYERRRGREWSVFNFFQFPGFVSHGRKAA